MSDRISNKINVFLDFDNTVTMFDVLDDMLSRFSKDDKWKDLEDKWQKGIIGSKECLEGQIRGIRITRRELDKYLDTIKLDPYFNRLISLFKARKIKVMILSDNFDYMIKHILRNNKIDDLVVYSNKIRIEKDRLIPSFPFTDKDCGNCAHCKKTNLLSHLDENAKSIYVGDGLSDVHPAKHSNIVFAKAQLLRYLKEKKIDHIPFNGLKDVYSYIKDKELT